LHTEWLVTEKRCTKRLVAKEEPYIMLRELT